MTGFGENNHWIVVSFTSSLGFRPDGALLLFPTSLPLNYLTFGKVKEPLTGLLSDSADTIKELGHNITKSFE
jgi:hypothetical protein